MLKSKPQKLLDESLTAKQNEPTKNNENGQIFKNANSKNEDTKTNDNSGHCHRKRHRIHKIRNHIKIEPEFDEKHLKHNSTPYDEQTHKHKSRHLNLDYYENKSKTTVMKTSKSIKSRTLYNGSTKKKKKVPKNTQEHAKTSQTLKTTNALPTQKRNKKNMLQFMLPSETAQSKVSKYLNEAKNSQSLSRENLILSFDKDIIDLSSSRSSSKSFEKIREKPIHLSKANAKLFEVNETKSNSREIGNMKEKNILNKSHNTNKLDRHTKKKLITNAIEKSKTLKVPSVKAPILSKSSTPTLQTQQTLISTSKHLTHNKSKESGKMNSLNDNLIGDTLISSESIFNSSLNCSHLNNTTFIRNMEFKFIEPPDHPPPPPPPNLKSDFRKTNFHTKVN